jgi:high-affinity nickel permease
VRRVYYDLSIMVALVIATIEIVGLLSTELRLHGWFGDAVANFDLNTAGFVVVALLLVKWAIALAGCSRPPLRETTNWLAGRGMPQPRRRRGGRS